MFKIKFKTYEVASASDTGNRRCTTAHAVIKHKRTLVGVGANQILKQCYWFLCRVQTALTGNFQKISRIVFIFCYIIGIQSVILNLPISLAASLVILRLV